MEEIPEIAPVVQYGFIRSVCPPDDGSIQISPHVLRRDGGYESKGIMLVAASCVNVLAPFDGKISQVLSRESLDPFHRKLIGDFPKNEEDHSIGFVIEGRIQVTILHARTRFAVGDSVEKGSVLSDRIIPVKGRLSHLHIFTHDGEKLVEARHIDSSINRFR